MESKNSERGQDQGPILDQLRQALESRNVEALANLYSEDAVLEEVSALNPPAHPLVVKGREAILKRLQETFTVDAVGGWHRDLKETVIIDAIETDDAIAFTEVHTYEAGDKVFMQYIGHKRGGLVERARLVVARDSE
jgi:hypothetical protein